MDIVLENAGKRYLREWIFRNLTYTFQTGESYAITGRNGSGKSTLAAVLTGQLLLTAGKVSHMIGSKPIDEHRVYQYTSLSAPYLELVEELTVEEMTDLHFNLKPLISGFTKKDVPAYAWLEEAKNKPVKHLSSGMKQRFKLALSFLSDTPLLILDEPTSNLDVHGIKWYNERLDEVIGGRLTVICSNQPYEYDVCKKVISIEDFK